MRTDKYIAALLLIAALTVHAHAQSNDRDFIRLGNRYFRFGQYQKAETFYRKAIDKSPSTEAYFNLGNSLVQQGQDSTAFEMYKRALDEPSNNKFKKAHVYHNMGNLTYANGLREMKTGGQNSMQAFQQAVELYKSSLRMNPNDNETRYNLAMAQYMLKKSQQDGGGGGQNDQNQDENQEREKQQQQQQQEQQQQEQQQPQQQKQQEQKNQMDDKTAEQLLNSAQQDEKNVQRKVQQQSAQPRKLEKDW